MIKKSTFAILYAEASNELTAILILGFIIITLRGLNTFITLIA